MTRHPATPITSLIRGRRSQRDAMLPAGLVPLELKRGLERLMLPGPGMMEDLVDGGRLLLGRHRYELASDTQVLLEDGQTVDSGAEGSYRLREGVANSLLGGDGDRRIFEDVPGGKALHADDADSLVLGDGHDLGLEGVEVGVQDAHRHLERIPGKPLRQHAAEDGWTLVPGEANEADLALLFRPHH